MKAFKIIALFFTVLSPTVSFASNPMILSINNKIDIPLPKDMQRLVVLDGGAYAAVMSDKKGDNIYYGTISLDELKKFGAKDSVYNFLNASFNSSVDNPTNDFEKIMIRGKFIKSDNPNVKIYGYRDSNYIFNNVYSKDLDFAVLINYDPKYKDYINLIKQVKIRG
ncbi:hypothetical protein IBE48_08230 [Francisella philomiragia]|uniref:Uncharacterized protein n=2 Tax=Francisella philomiragia TaxID=28110 RepID=A0AAW3D9C3_9GAMM|nr:hypothetical protein [Francisella philomiragia]KFJ42185.1 hypothetical protein DR78_500 [Francisella philomiragia]MBK2281528.1 hypothetical protein [Francisella philomiragia]MBK2283363.1 hypothetical protein [Francisella philomiragia]MBK2285394.1 hypothetical protein [Francisella philomiragia]MBK2293417.1 hypothetical protein [Francisella philomiragia]